MASLAHVGRGDSARSNEEDCAFLDPSMSPPMASNTMALVMLQTVPNIKHNNNNNIPMVASTVMCPKKKLQH
jgi:hypothetical protein